jgi:hypothetical protein
MPSVFLARNRKKDGGEGEGNGFLKLINIFAGYKYLIA